MKRADVELMRRLHDLVPLVVVIAKADTMTTAETRKFKNDVCRQLAAEQVRTFTFDPRTIKDVEALHSIHAAEGFEPLYGGASGQLPWAVMGADESRREYLCASAPDVSSHIPSAILRAVLPAMLPTMLPAHLPAMLPAMLAARTANTYAQVGYGDH